MKKIRNTKGFTLIELLAVIVVLAIIMVIATTQVNATIKKSRANSFVESYQMMYKSLKSSAIAGNTAEEALKELEASKNDYDVKVSADTSTGTYTLTVCAKGITYNAPSGSDAATETGKASGKFSNMNLLEYYNPSQANGDKNAIDSNIGDTYNVTTHCINSSYTV